MWAWRYTVGPQVYIFTNPGSNGANGSLLPVRVLCRLRTARFRLPASARGLRLEGARPPLADLSARLPLPADLDITFAPDYDRDRKGVLEGFFPPLLAIIHPSLFVLNSAL